MGGQNLAKFPQPKRNDDQSAERRHAETKMGFHNQGQRKRHPGGLRRYGLLPRLGWILLRGQCEHWRLAMVEAGGALDRRRGRLGAK